MAACGSSSPTSTLAGNGGNALFTESLTGLTIHDVVWIGLPVFTVEGKANLRIISVRFGHYPADVLSTPRFYRIVLDQVGGRAITVFPDDQFRRDHYVIDGPYVGTVLHPGNPIDYGVAKLTVEAPGDHKISDVIVRYAEPDGSTRTQTFHIHYVI